MSQDATQELELEGTAPAEPVKPKRKSPERYGPVRAIDLERLEEQAKNTTADELDDLEREISKLALRQKIAEAAEKKDKRGSKK